MPSGIMCKLLHTKRSLSCFRDVRDATYNHQGGGEKLDVIIGATQIGLG